MLRVAALILLAAFAEVWAQSAPILPERETQSEIFGDQPRRGGVFKANEAMIVRVPLDTASVLDGAYPIDSSGYVNLPVVGRLYVHDKPAVEIETYLGKRMSQYLRDTHIMATPVVRLTLLGHWRQPGMHYVDSEASIWEACRVGGGPAGEQNIDKWLVKRGGQDLAISLLDEFSKGTTLRNAGIRSGDIFVIPQPNPQSGFWYWFRESLTATAQIATILGTSLTVYITYLLIEDQNNGT